MHLIALQHHYLELPLQSLLDLPRLQGRTYIVFRDALSLASTSERNEQVYQWSELQKRIRRKNNKNANTRFLCD
jgi:predicted YcjX-like family ATPase